MSWVEVLTLIALIVGPISAVLITRYMDYRRERQQRRMEIFRTLMRTRRTPVEPAHVGALNLIEIEFATDAEVIRAWKELLTHFGTEHTRRADERHVEGLTPEQVSARDRVFHDRLFDERQRLLAKLLHAMARVLNFKVEQLEIFEGGYTPQGWFNVELENMAVRRLFAEIAIGRRTLPIGVFDYTKIGDRADQSQAQIENPSTSGESD